jgi:hypothetical protein
MKPGPQSPGFLYVGGRRPRLPHYVRDTCLADAHIYQRTRTTLALPRAWQMSTSASEQEQRSPFHVPGRCPHLPANKNNARPSTCLADVHICQRRNQTYRWNEKSRSIGIIPDSLPLHSAALEYGHSSGSPTKPALTGLVWIYSTFLLNCRSLTITSSSYLGCQNRYLPFAEN